jgi:hypothetical protein
LRDVLKADDRANFANALADMLLSVRNARVHANFPKAGPRRLGDRDNVSFRRRVRLVDGAFVSIPAPINYEINTVAQIQLSIGKLLLGAKTKQSPEDIENIVRSRVRQLKNEIYDRVTKWHRSK